MSVYFGSEPNIFLPNKFPWEKLNLTELMGKSCLWKPQLKNIGYVVKSEGYGGPEIRISMND